MFAQNIKKISASCALASALLLSGCSTMNGYDNTMNKGLIGAAAGAATGAIIGNNVGGGDAQAGALIGAALGGAGGAYFGCHQDGRCGSQKQYYPQNAQPCQNGQYGTSQYGQQGSARPTTQPCATQGAQGQYATGQYNGQATGHTSQPYISQNANQTLNKRQFFDQRTGRYFYYDPATRQEYYENGQRKYI